MSDRSRPRQCDETPGGRKEPQAPVTMRPGSPHPVENDEAAPRRAGTAGELADLPDAILVREAKTGSHPAFGELVRRYQDKIYTIVFGQLLSREDALDLTQDVFIKAHRKLSAFREDCIFYTWLYRIAVNSCIDFARRKKRSQEPFSLEDQVLGEAGYEPVDESVRADPERTLVNKEMGGLLRSWIQALPEPLRMAVILHDIEGLPQKEIAAIMGCPLGTVKSRIQRGRFELRDRLRPYLDGTMT